MSKLSEGEVHVEAMRLILAEMERREDIPDWTIWQHMLNMLETIFQGIVDQRADDADEIDSLRKELADAQRAVSDAFAEVNSVREQLDAARAEIETLRGAMAADDQRLRDAEERIWPGVTWGCDAPDKMAEEILHLRHSLKVAQADNVMLSKWLSEETDRHRATHAEKIELFQQKESANKHNAELRGKLDAAQAAVTLQRAGIERLQAFVNLSRRLLGVHMNYADVDRLRSALAELDAGTEPAPVAEPIDAEGGA